MGVPKDKEPKNESVSSSSPNDSTIIENSSKKDRKKPNQVLYTPGKGLLKNSKLEDCNVRKENTSPPPNDGNSNGNDSDPQKSKAPRSRRPTREVYVPKGKAVAQLCEKDDAPQSNKSEARKRNNETSRKRQNRNNHYNRNNSNKRAERMNGKEASGSNKGSNSSSPVHNESWANIMDEANFSNSRQSTPEAEVNSVDSHSSTFKTKDQTVGNQRNRSRSRKKSFRQETSVSNQRGNNNTRSSDRRKNGDRRGGSHQPARENRNGRSQSAKPPTDDGSKKKPEKGNPHKKAEKEVGSDSKEVFSGHVLKVSANKVNEDRKKQNNPEYSLPPRFQRNKISNSETPTSNLPCQNGSGGILKLPPHFDMMPTEVVEPIVIPPVFSDTFMPKQLFDPNNPNQPEIVSIPAPVPRPGIYPPYYLRHPFASAVANTGYIPPPRPPSFAVYSNIVYDSSREQFIIPPDYVQPQPMLQPLRISPFEPAPVIPEPTKKRYKPIVENNLREIVLLDKELSGLIAEGIDINSNALKQCRWKLQLRYENIILADPKYCIDKNPEQCLWKSVFHQIIEMIRNQLEDNPEEEEKMKEYLLNLILEGTFFFENLLEKLQETHKFKLSEVLDTEMISSSCLREDLKPVLINVQKTLIFMGDLARYKEQVQKTTNYGKARSLYLKAQHINPKNGKPYHQLALLAVNTNRKLDAVYYFMRSLAASNPFLSAKEHLLNLFEDARKKFELYEKKRLIKAEETQQFEVNTTEQWEIWIKPDGSSSEKPTDKNIDSSDLKDLSDVDLNKRFGISFLHVHGKLFTKIGMETFPQVLRQMLREFYCLLQRNPIPMTPSRILQLVAINIFSVTYSSLKEGGRDQGGTSMLQEQALYTSMIMMSLLMDRCQMLHMADKSSPGSNKQIIGEGLAILLPAVKVWTDWMSCQKSLWAPVPVALQEKLNSGFDKDVWTSFAELLTALSEVDIKEPEIIESPIINSEPIILDEDKTFSGFVPLFDAITKPAFCVQPFDKDKAKHCCRISRIVFFGDYLCGVTPPYLKYHVESKKFVSLVTPVSKKESFETSPLNISSDESQSKSSVVQETLDESFNVDRDEIQMLKSRKEALSKAKKEQEMHEAKIQAVLLEHENQQRSVLKIKPKYLIPDTNCFIDHLPLFRNILSSTDFHLIVPLVVINELDGLTKGTRVNGRNSPDLNNRVTLLSKEAINFLEKQFASRHPHLRAITSQGSILDSIAFRSEETGQNEGTNDDMILTCCLSYCKENPEASMPKNKDEPLALFREVVLLTDDRNLRVKALAHHVPVRDLLSFLQWANS